MDDDFERRDSEERRLAFAQAVMDLCNQWSMRLDRPWLAIRAQDDGHEMALKRKALDCDGDACVHSRLKETTDAQ